jgi:hypothetical protein
MTLRIANIVLVFLIVITVRGCIECCENVQQIVLSGYEVQQ